MLFFSLVLLEGVVFFWVIYVQYTPTFVEVYVCLFGWQVCQIESLLFAI